MRKQRQEARMLFEQNVVEKAFAQLAGADNVISKTEFGNFLESKTTSRGTPDIYSEFNHWLKLNLDKEWVDPAYRKKK